jgi:pimeloyl-ACP methyl ester carboxylesterase
MPACVRRVLAGAAVAAAWIATAPGEAVAARISWHACGKQLQCARAPVPLDWARPDGRTISLAVIRHRASRPQRRIGSLFFNPGGPGQSGVDTVRQAGADLDALGRGRFDVVSWDIRGSGRSRGVSCFASAGARARFWADRPVPNTGSEERSYLARTTAFARRCGARNGELLAHITTADTVRDLDYLRRLVGDRGLTFAGQSAGTLIGQIYANMFPRRVRAVALDGVVDPVAYTKGNAPWLASSLASVDRTFDAFLALCQSAGPDRCALAGSVPAEQRARELLARLRRGPLPAPSATPAGALTYGEALTAIKSGYLLSPSTWQQLARDLKAAADSDGSALASTARTFATESFHRSFEPIQAIICADSPAREDAKAWPRVIDGLTRVSRIGASFVGWVVGAPCASWPVPSADPYTGPWGASTPNPILLVSNRLDPNTPLAGARHAERLLGNAVLLTNDGYGHISSSDPSACVDQAISRYVVDLVTPARGTVCRPDRDPFDPDFGKPLG